jgi:PKD repeat protein
MKTIYKLLFLVLSFQAVNGFAICNFTIDRTTVCAGDVVTIRLAQPYAKYHNIIVYKGNYPFGSVALSPADYSVLLPYDPTKDNEIKITFRGLTTPQQFRILLAESESDLNPVPQIPCNSGQIITVNPSPDPFITDPNNFVFCGVTTAQTVSISNISKTLAINTNYTIDWGDGSPVVNTATFNAPITHTYNPGSYTLTYTVAGSTPAPCNTATRKYNVLIGKAPTLAIVPSNPTVCVPADYKLPISLGQTTAVNSASTLYKIFVNGELDTIYNNSNLPDTIRYNFTKGSCGSVSKDCSNDNNFSVRVYAVNECDVTDVAQCFLVLDSVRPVIGGKDTVCVGDLEQYRNTDQFSRDRLCNEPLKTWGVLPASGFNTGTPLNTPTLNNLNITFTDTGHYRISLGVTGECNSKDTFKDIVVVEKVTALAKFVSPPCIPASGFIDVPITNLSTKRPSARGYTWTVTPSAGTTILPNPNADSVTIRFTISGSYTISLQVDGACNPSIWDSVLVIKGKPAIDTLRIPEGCSVPYILTNPAQYFNYTNGGDPNATFGWVFTGGSPSISALENPANITYATPGTYPIALTINAECGDSLLTNFITINNFPKPNAGPDISICKSDVPAPLSALPAGGIWRGTGITDSLLGIFDPARVPTATSQIIYVLNPTSFCPTYDTLVITLVELLGLNAGPDQTICKSTGNLTLINDPAFPGGNWIGTGVIDNALGIFDPNPLAPGVYQVGYVYLDASGACRDTAYKRVTVYDSIRVSAAPELCVGQSFNFGTLVSNITSAIWKFGDGTPDGIIINSFHTYANPGNYIVTLIGETADRCRDTIRIPVTVIANPPLLFTVAPDSSCTGNNILFTIPAGHDTTTNYIWDFGIATVQTATPDPQTFSFPQPILRDTLYFVTLRADYFCGPSFYTDTVKVKASPKANIGVQSIGCSPFQPILANTSFGSPTTFLWNFGNGQTSTLQNPVAPTYINSTRRDTTYTISLKVTNACGSDSTSKTITVKGNDVFANFFTNINQGCQPLTVDFFNISSPGAEIIWDFGDGTSAYADQISHVYDSAGIFRVKLLAIGQCGRDSFFTTVNVFNTPKPDFIVNNPCAGSAAQFVNQTTGGNSYVWDFGDGSISTQANPTHVYSAVGTYTVKLIVANSRPCVDSIIKQIGVFTKPNAAFSVASPKVCEQEPTVFLNNSTEASTFIWSFGNGEISTQAAPDYTYPAPGVFNVSLVAINGGCRDSTTNVAAVEIYPKPIADFIYTITSNGFNDPVIFTNTTVFGNSFFWTFGDGDTSVERDPTHQYDGVGPYRVTLFTESNKGCKDTVSYPLGVDYDGQLYVPNVFAPEVGLGESAIFKPKGLSMKEYHIEVFSTYGQLLWESKTLENGQPTEGWDGRYKGTILPQDIYVWKIRAIFENGRAWEGMKDPKTGKRSIMGSVLLLR